jgi:hypothetical protein
MYPRITDIVRRTIKSDRKKSAPLRDIKRRMMLEETGSALCDRIEELLRESGLVPSEEKVQFGNSSGVATLKGFVIDPRVRAGPAAVPPTDEETDNMDFSDLGSVAESVGVSGPGRILEENQALRGGIEWVRRCLQEAMRGTRQLTPQNVLSMLDRIALIADNIGRQVQPADEDVMEHVINTFDRMSLMAGDPQPRPPTAQNSNPSPIRGPS